MICPAMIYCAKNPTENQLRFLVNYLLLYCIKADPCKLAAPYMKAQDRMVQLNAHKCMEKINAFFQIFPGTGSLSWSNIEG